MATVTIVDRRKTISASGPRTGQIQTLVTYRDEGGNFFLVVIDKDPVTEADITAAIKKDIAERGETVGKTLTV